MRILVPLMLAVFVSWPPSVLGETDATPGHLVDVTNQAYPTIVEEIVEYVVNPPRAECFSLSDVEEYSGDGQQVGLSTLPAGVDIGDMSAFEGHPGVYVGIQQDDRGYEYYGYQVDYNLNDWTDCLGAR